MKYLDSGKSVPEIGVELGVDAIIEGSVLRAGETVRVTAQLIDARNDQHLWAENFDRELTDILGLYADVTRNIATSIRGSLTPEESARLGAQNTVDVNAYDAYLRGNYLCDQWTPEYMRRGIELMRDALRINPDSALYQAALAQCLQYASFYDYVAPTEIHDEANTLVRKAVSLDDTLSEAWAAYAAVRYYLDYDVVGAKLALEKAVELNPSNARAMIHYSWLLGLGAASGRAGPAVTYRADGARTGLLPERSIRGCPGRIPQITGAGPGRPVVPFLRRVGARATTRPL
jgi:tetratricopeptide (TPR) repeat protein